MMKTTKVKDLAEFCENFDFAPMSQMPPLPLHDYNELNDFYLILVSSVYVVTEGKLATKITASSLRKSKHRERDF